MTDPGNEVVIEFALTFFSELLCGSCLGRQKLQSRLYFKSSCGVLGKVFNQQ